MLWLMDQPSDIVPTPKTYYLTTTKAIGDGTVLKPWTLIQALKNPPVLNTGDKVSLVISVRLTIEV